MWPVRHDGVLLLEFRKSLFLTPVILYFCYTVGAFKGTSDPFAVVTQLSTKPGERPVVLGRSEVVKNSLSPEWVKVYHLEYSMGTTCKVAVNIFDEVRKSNNIGMGSAVFDVAAVLGAYGNTKVGEAL